MYDLREAIILAGGFGTRLAHVVSDVCKPMAPVAGQPFMRFILDQLADQRFDRVIIADGYKRESIEGFFGSQYRGMDIIYSPEDTPLGTGGAVKRALSFCKTEWVFVVNGDTYFDIDYQSMMESNGYADGSGDVVIAVKPMKDFDRYGTVDVASSGMILGFNEKKPCNEGLINAGVYLMRRDALDSMPEIFSLESDYFESIVDQGVLFAVVNKGVFIDIGIPEDYECAQTLLSPLARSWNLAFFDRDGTINVDAGHLFEPEKLVLIPKTIEILKRFSEDPEWKTVVVTNQAGIAKGFYSEEDMRHLHHVLDAALAEQGCRIDAYYFCPHHPDFTEDCACRKPKPGMILAAMKDFCASPEHCVMYGDKESDMQAALASGIEDRRLIR